MLDSSDVCYNNLIHNTVELSSIIKLRITSSPCANFLCFCRNNQLLYSNTEEPEYTEYSWVSAQLLTCFFFFLLLISIFTAQHFSKQRHLSPLFHPCSPFSFCFFLVILPLPRYAACSACAVILISKDLEFWVSKPQTLSLGTIVYTRGHCREKNRRHIGDRVRREQSLEERNFHLSQGHFQQVGLSNQPHRVS